MTFLWPEMLWLLLAAPVLVGIYILLLRRRKKGAVRYASLSLVREAIGPGQRFRRHVPPALFLLAMIATILAIARPSAVITLPSEQRVIVMALDVSLSMRATDIEPIRFAAAKEAAKAFVQEQPKDVRIGIVSFAGTASVVQAPTQNREDLVGAIDRLELQRHTAIGSAIIMSLAALFPDDGIDLESILFGARPSPDGGRFGPLDKDKARKAEKEKKPFTPVQPGTHPSAAIILLTDGRRTTGPDPLDAARMAAERGVRVYTVGFGQGRLVRQHRRLVDLHAVRRGIAEGDRGPHPGRVLPRRERRRPEEGLRHAEREVRAGAEGNRDHRDRDRGRGGARRRCRRALDPLVQSDRLTAAAPAPRAGRAPIQRAHEHVHPDHEQPGEEPAAERLRPDAAPDLLAEEHPGERRDECQRRGRRSGCGKLAGRGKTGGERNRGDRERQTERLDERLPLEPERA
jgi:Ca-activated chloride channel family protein